MGLVSVLGKSILGICRLQSSGKFDNHPLCLQWLSFLLLFPPFFEKIN